MASKAGQPHNGRYVAYYRVSTDRQGASGLGLEAQQDAVRRHLNGGTWNLIGEFTEVESGRRGSRPRLDEALALAKKERATLVVAKLDRLYRNLHFISKLMHEGVDFVACDNPHATKLTIHILAAVAEHEAELISDRTKAALQAVRARGVKLGSPTPEIGAEAGGEAVAAEADRKALNIQPLIADLRRRGVDTYRQLADALNARGVPTARGGAWFASTVRNYELRQVVQDLPNPLKKGEK
jgi:DNA invertase Pin-like site-specific DNA recombinase